MSIMPYYSLNIWYSYTDAAVKSAARFYAEISDDQGWTKAGTKDGVDIQRKKVHEHSPVNLITLKHFVFSSRSQPL